MLEREIQDYIFACPEFLFPGQTIQKKQREFHVAGRRIDLLFQIDDIQYIVELKRDPINREHIGQVIEYYGLMREALREGKFRMILVSPSIPAFRKVFLEELGIRCVEFPGIPRSERDLDLLRSKVSADVPPIRGIPITSSLSFQRLTTPGASQALEVSHEVLRNSLEGIGRAFAGFDVLPIRMAYAESPDVIHRNCPASLVSPGEFVRAGVWWAYRFGHSENMPKNNVPNISVMGMPWALDLAVNAEIRPSQNVLRKRIAEAPGTFDGLVKSHGRLQFQALLKLEHQPRFHHWIPLACDEPGSWNGARVLKVWEECEAGFSQLRDSWINWIEKSRRILSSGQRAHLRRTNQSLNLALRFVRPFCREDEFWSISYSDQCSKLVAECQHLRPLVEFFQSI